MQRLTPLRVLLIDDNIEFAKAAAEWLTEAGHEVEVQQSGATALGRAQAESFDVILLDMVMPQMDGLDFMRQLPTEGGRPEVVVVSGAVTVRSAVDAMKLGAYDCIPKNAGFEAMDLVVQKAGEAHRLCRDLRLLSRRIEHQNSAPEIVTRSREMKKVLDVLQRVAESNVSVLITGESGTGKDLVARSLHALSRRAPGPFVDINCAALSESLLEAELFGHEKGAFTGAIATRPGLVEAADGGTLFLDEVVEMPTPLQAKLLRTTEDRTLYRVGGRQRIRVDVRIVAATNRDLQREIAAGRLREDLYYRLAGVEIPIPPLRDRPEDVEPIALHYLRIAVRQAGRGPTAISPEALLALQSYRWPGNVRELRNLMDRMALLAGGEVIGVENLPREILDSQAHLARLRPPAAIPTEMPLRELERHQIQRVLNEEGWHHGRAAARLGLPLRTLYRKIKTYQLSRPIAGSRTA
jgi:DNA-binding NtrC family response regulator